MRARRRKAIKNVNAMRASMRAISRLKELARTSRKVLSVAKAKNPKQDELLTESASEPMLVQHGVLVPRSETETEHTRSAVSLTTIDVDAELSAIREDDEVDAVTSPVDKPDQHIDPTPTPRVQTRILRPQSAPFKTFTKYCSASRTSSRASGAMATRNLHSAPPHGRPSGNTRDRKNKDAFVAPCLRTVTSGPHSSTLSLMQDRPRHTQSAAAPSRRTAWQAADPAQRKYYYPAEPSKERVHDAYRKLVRNLHTRNAHSRLLLCSNYPTYLRTERY